MAVVGTAGVQGMLPLFQAVVAVIHVLVAIHVGRVVMDTVIMTGIDVGCRLGSA